MLASRKENSFKRWPRGQKFTIAPDGIAAEEAYRAAVASSRQAGRSALDAALAAWAAPLHVEPGDGVVLSELRGRRLGIAELCAALEEAGIARDEVRGALDRLVDAGAVVPVPLASHAA